MIKQPLMAYFNMGIFSYEYRPSLVHQVLVSFNAAGHQGTKKQKMRGEVSGGNKKPWRQKSTGRARASTTRSPLWRKGGVTFAARGLPGKQVKINKKMYRGALKSILTQLYSSEGLTIFKNLVCESYKTRDFVENYTFTEPSLIVVNSLTPALILATRNLKHIEVIESSKIDPHILLKHKNIYLEHAAVHTLEERLTR